MIFDRNFCLEKKNPSSEEILAIREEVLFFTKKSFHSRTRQFDFSYVCLLHIKHWKKIQISNLRVSLLTSDCSFYDANSHIDDRHLRTRKSLRRRDRSPKTRIVTTGCRQSGRPYSGRGVHEERNRRRRRLRFRIARSPASTGIAARVLGNVVHVVHASHPLFLVMRPLVLATPFTTSVVTTSPSTVFSSLTFSPASMVSPLFRSPSS